MGLLIFSSFGSTENIAIEHEKAQVVSTLVKYASWPPESRRLKFTIGVYDNSAFHSTLKAYFSDKKIKGKAIKVINVVTLEQAKKVNLLYVPFQHRLQLKTLVEKTRNRHILLVSENNKDIENIMVNLQYGSDESEIVFEINTVNINNEKLSLSSWLTLISNKKMIVKVSNPQAAELTPKTITSPPPVSNAIVSSEQMLLEKQLTSLNQQVLVQEIKLNSLLQQNKTSKKNIARNKLASSKLISKLKKQEKELSIKEQSVENEEKKLSKLTEQVKQKNELTNQKGNEQQFAGIKELELKTQQITTLNKQLKQQKVLLNNQAIEQKEILQKALEQKSVGVPFYFIVSIALITLLIVSFLLFRYKKMQASQIEVLTSLTQREQQLVKSEQVASLGYVASDITYATASALDDVYQKCRKSKEPISSNHLQPILALLESFNQIAADQDEEEIKHFDLVSYINTIMILFSTEFKHSNINYSYIGEKSLLIDSVASQITIVILNLVNNALKHGFTDNRAGKLIINIEKTAQNKTKITFKDNGVGMDNSILTQCCIPFFTTKADRGYVGIGLSTVDDIVKNILSGTILLTSVPEQGTTVCIIF